MLMWRMCMVALVFAVALSFTPAYAANAGSRQELLH